MTYELKLLLHHLHLSYYYVHNKRPAMGRMELTQAVRILRLFKNDFSDVMDMYVRASSTLAQLKYGWAGIRTKDRVLDSLDVLIDEVENLCEGRMAA